MTFTRASILGSVGFSLLQLACSTAKPAPTNDSYTRDERIDQTPAGEDGGAAASGGAPATSCDYRQDRLEPDKLKWKNTLPRPRELVPTTDNGTDYEIIARQKDLQMLPDCYPTTKVFAFGGVTRALGETTSTEVFSTPGPTLEMTRDKAVTVTWINDIEGPHLFKIDPTLHWANPKKYADPPKGPFTLESKIDSKWQETVPIVTHVHGLEVAPSSDGAPDAWFTRGWVEVGEKFPKVKEALEKKSYYPNSQPATTLWYHDHALGITRLNVYAGLAGMYIIRDESAAGKAIEAKLPDREHEMPLVIQDRQFNDDGSLSYPTSPSEHHPYWTSAVVGDTMVVNGKVWPKMPVERTRYRFRILNGANYSSFNLSLVTSLKETLPFTVIGTDGGYLKQPADTQKLSLAPGERADVVIDFSSVQADAVILRHDGDEIVKFEVPPPPSVAPAPTSCQLTGTESETLCFPNGLNTNANDLDLDPEKKPDEKRIVTLIDAGEHAVYLDGLAFHSDVKETPRIGTTEDWTIVNATYTDHPIHLHLVQFKLLGRDAIDPDAYSASWKELNGSVLPLTKAPTNPEPQILGPGAPIEVAESGWKDTVLVPGSSVTRIRVRWTPQDAPTFPFSAEGDYVWHCHMLEHEDNEMMRPLRLLPGPKGTGGTSQTP